MTYDGDDIERRIEKNVLGWADTGSAAISIAISLKRIANALESLNANADELIKAVDNLSDRSR